MMQRLLLLAVAAVMVLGGAFWMSKVGNQPHRPPVEKDVPAAAPTAPPTATPVAPHPPAAGSATPSPTAGQALWVAASGRVAPISGEVPLGFGLTGIIREVTVKEGDTVHQGQVLARLAADALQARVDAAEQALAAAPAGERKKALAVTVAEARAEAEKAVLRSPLDGVVLQVIRQPGEMVSVAFESPVVRVGDISQLQVRAAVDARDVDKIGVGQKAVLRAEAYGDRKFAGYVSHIARVLRPREGHGDTAPVLEVLIHLDGSVELPVGLPMDVFIITGLGGEKALPAKRP